MLPGFDWSKIQDPTANYNVSAGLSPLAKFLGEHSGGVVFRAEDLEHLEVQPGIVTDMKLRKK